MKNFSVGEFSTFFCSVSTLIGILVYNYINIDICALSIKNI